MGQAGYQIKPAVACPRDTGKAAGKQPLQPVGEGDHGRYVFTARPLVTSEYRNSAGFPAYVGAENPAQGADIAQTQIDALSGKRMKIMGGVSDQGKARTDQLPGMTQCDRQT